MAKFDAKLSDVVSSYLTETLGNDIDLGAQGPYLFPHAGAAQGRVDAGDRRGCLSCRRACIHPNSFKLARLSWKWSSVGGAAKTQEAVWFHRTCDPRF